MEYVYERLKSVGVDSLKPVFRPFICLMSEVMPAKLELFSGDDDEGECVGGWVQFACPRLSIDWGESFRVRGSAGVFLYRSAFAALCA